MNTFTKSVSILSLAIFASSLHASEGWFGKAGVARFSESEAGVNLDLDAIFVGGGYSFKVAENFYIAPEIRFAKGIGSEDIFGVDVEIDTAWFAGVRGILKADSGLFGFVSAGYGDISIDASMGSVSESASADDIGFGAGFGYEFNQKFALELGFEDYDGTDVVQLGANFRF
ncbi:outer membrane beta-barrel protein [Pelagicoccus sp. SDUM812002]|uniref:outer membrane beta-barrel protein n=1 Tax=Pelagicoccus sp. SDUM812002 TaxID=3041266 RepID=UPI00280D599A|nr:outer membrane beta-barrel protein [Pelagicoccus sp. SDUM812002]MDQ8187083.1 outer membrane beta-barrel protein [Pelagicoccus sp. SDUM812002]